MRNVRVAAIQALPVSPNIDRMRAGDDVPHAIELLHEAKSLGADIACFPEMYPYVGEDELRRAARDLDLWVIAGLITESEAGKVLNTATLISNEGVIVGRQPKCYPTEGEKALGIEAGEGFTVFETPWGRMGIAICADFAFSRVGIDELMRQRADIIFNPAWWFALGEAYSSVIVGRHLEYGVPVVGVDVAAMSLVTDETRPDLAFPRAGGHTTVAVTPPVAGLGELDSWFRSKPGGSNSVEGFVSKLDLDEGTILVDIDIEAVRRFPGYWYSSAAREVRDAAVAALP